jgi:hypothetical protein
MKIVKVKYISGYKLAVTFADGTGKVLDLQYFLLQARNPMITKYMDKKLFKQVTLHSGSLNWNDEMDFDYLDIYNNVFAKPKPSYA